MKNRKILIIGAVVLICVVGIIALVLENTNKYLGTWDCVSAEIDGSIFTIAELEEMGDYTLSDFRIVLKSGGIAYLYSQGEETLIEWSKNENGINIGIRKMTFDGEFLKLSNNGITLRLEKTSNSQIIQAPSDNKNENGTTTSTTTTTHKNTTTTTTTPTTTSINDNNPPEDEFDLLNNTVYNVVDAELTAIEQEWEELKSLVEDYDDYVSNIEEIEAFYEKIIVVCSELQIQCYQYVIEYAEIILSSNKSHYDKYDDLNVIYDEIYDGALDEMYDRIYDDLLEDIYDAFYGGVLQDASGYISWDEYYDVLSDEYDRWSDTLSDVYDIYADSLSDVYGFYVDIGSELLSYDIDGAEHEIEDFKEKIERLK